MLPKTTPDATPATLAAPTHPGAHPNPLGQLSLDELRRRTSMKWRTYPEDVLPLWVAEMDVPLAEPVARALTDAIALGDTGYPAGTAYAEALAEFAGKRWGWDDFAVERTAIVPDVMLGIVEMLKLVTGPGDPVVVNCPVYPPFYQFVRHMDRTVVEAPLGEDGRLDFAELESAFDRVTEGGRRRAAYLLCNPHNPTGTLHTTDELTTVARLSHTYGIRVVADEIHAPLVSPGARFVPYLTVPGGENAFSLMSASKAWNLAGLKAALAIAGPDAAAELAELPEEVSHGPSHVGILAHTAALRDAGPWLDALLLGLDENHAAAFRPLGRASAFRGLRPLRVHLPRLAGLPVPAPRRRPGVRLPGTGPSRPELRHPLRHGRRRTRTPEPGDVCGTAHGGGATDGAGAGLKRRLGRWVI